jgi:hypothetical protein
MSDDKGTPATVTGNAVAPSPAQKFRNYMAERAAAESSVTAEDVAGNQIDKVFQATDAAGIFGAVSGGTIQARDVVGLTVEIHSMRMQESERFDGNPYYANLDVTVLGGPREVLSRAAVEIGANAILQTGAEIIIAQVRALEANQLLPQAATIQGTETSNGFTVLKLGEPPVQATRGQSE